MLLQTRINIIKVLVFDYMYECNQIMEIFAYHSTSLFTRAFDTSFEKREDTEYHN